MNPSTLLGMVIGTLLLVIVLAFTAHDLGAFLNVPGLALVLGGTLAATLISYPLDEVLRVFHIFSIVMGREHVHAQEDLQEIVDVTRMWVRGEIDEVEQHLEEIRNPFLKMGLSLIVEDTPMDDVMDLLRWRIYRLRAREAAEAQIFRSMAMYAPAFGMLGTLVGLINMLLSVEASDFSSISLNLGIALVTTFYGILLANLLFKPIAIKMERRSEQRVMLMNMVMEGINLMSKGRSPRYIQETLNSFMARFADEIYQHEPTPADQQRTE